MKLLEESFKKMTEYESKLEENDKKYLEDISNIRLPLGDLIDDSKSPLI